MKEIDITTDGNVGGHPEKIQISNGNNNVTTLCSKAETIKTYASERLVIC